MNELARPFQSLGRSGLKKFNFLGAVTLLLLSNLIFPSSSNARHTYVGDSKYIKFQMSIDNGLEKIIRKDFKLLDQFKILNLSPRSREIFEIPYYLNTEKAEGYFKSWVYKRVHFFIKDTSSEKLIDKVKVEQEKILYPFSKEWPSLDYVSLETNMKDEKSQWEAVSAFSENSEKLMSNISAPIYYTGKIQSVVYKLKIHTGVFSAKEVIINSPRAGIIQLGSALDEDKYLINKVNPAAEINSILRLSILFHEGRHSDGRGKTLGFLHARCPKGHTYAGSFACDFNTNGPYTVGAEVGKILLKGCKTCTVSEKEKMNLMILDSLSRKVGQEKYPTESICHSAIASENDICDWDATPERIVK